MKKMPINNDKEKEFEQYLSILIETTFGFRPIIVAEETGDGVMSVTLDGTQVERSIMMGKDAKTYQTLKHLLRLFARRNNCYSFLRIKPSEGYIKEKRFSL